MEVVTGTVMSLNQKTGKGWIAMDGDDEQVNMEII